jgi:hypothetical protein
MALSGSKPQAISQQPQPPNHLLGDGYDIRTVQSAGADGSQRRENNDDLYACHEPWCERRSQSG